MLYEGEHVSIAALPGMRERTIVLDGFSKTYAMTGWRLGYGDLPARAGPGDHAPDDQQQLLHGDASPRWPASAALTGPQEASAAMVAEFRRRRDVIVDGLNAIPGITCRVPHGAFYVFPNITGTGLPVARAGRSAAGRGRRGGARGHGVRQVRRGLPAPLLRQLDREHPEGAGPDEGVAGGPRGGGWTEGGWRGDGEGRGPGEGARERHEARQRGQRRDGRGQERQWAASRAALDGHDRQSRWVE